MKRAVKTRKAHTRQLSIMSNPGRVLLASGTFVCLLSMCVADETDRRPIGPKSRAPRTLEDLVQRPPVQSTNWVAPNWPAPSIDEQQLASLGIRKLSGRHISIYTDLRDDPAVDELPTVFDAAVPLWCAYFGVAPATLNEWRVVAYVIRDKQRFQTANVLRSDLAPFMNGYQLRNELWLYDQPSPYYRRRCCFTKAHTHL